MDYEELLCKLFQLKKEKRDHKAFEFLHAFLGYPDRHYPTIHVGGTNGKGSVSLKIAKAYQYEGKRVGLYTSPHLFRFEERIRIGDSPICKETVFFMLKELLTLSQKHALNLSFFEVTTLLAFSYFKEQKVDCAVIEVGIGGRFDATNVIDPLLSVITSISLDHTELLGDTEEIIAFEKAGIIKPARPVVLGPAARFASIYKEAEKNKSPVIEAQETQEWYDVENQGIARAALSALGVSETSIQKGILERPLCRFQLVQESPPLILDVAHNPEGLKATLKALSIHYPGFSLRVILGLSKDKDCARFTEILIEKATHIDIVKAKHERALSIESIKDALESLGYPYYSEGKDLIELLHHQTENEVLLVCGTFYLMSEIEASLKISSISSLVKKVGSVSPNATA